MSVATGKGADIRSQRESLELAPESSLRGIASLVARGAGLCSDAQPELKVGNVPEYPDFVI